MAILTGAWASVQNATPADQVLEGARRLLVTLLVHAATLKATHVAQVSSSGFLIIPQFEPHMAVAIVLAAHAVYGQGCLLSVAGGKWRALNLVHTNSMPDVPCLPPGQSEDAQLKLLKEELMATVERINSRARSKPPIFEPDDFRAQVSVLTERLHAQPLLIDDAGKLDDAHCQVLQNELNVRVLQVAIDEQTPPSVDRDSWRNHCYSIQTTLNCFLPKEGIVMPQTPVNQASKLIINIDTVNGDVNSQVDGSGNYQVKNTELTQGMTAADLALAFTDFKSALSRVSPLHPVLSHLGAVEEVVKSKDQSPVSKRVLAGFVTALGIGSQAGEITENYKNLNEVLEPLKDAIKSYWPQALELLGLNT